MRDILPETSISAAAEIKIANFHKNIIAEVKSAIATHRIVVVGMARNPFVKKAKQLLSEKGLEFHYLEYGSYFSQWKPRLAIKMWSGWATFPQIFIDGVLIGGFADLVAHLEKNKIA
jgi:glutaredoxin-related protein